MVVEGSSFSWQIRFLTICGLAGCGWFAVGAGAGAV
jgi:hypothetical protein